MGCVSSIPSANLEHIQRCLVGSKQSFLLNNNEKNTLFLKHCRMQRYNDGDLLYAENDNAGFFHLVYSGSVQVTDDLGNVDIYGAHDLLGERAYGNKRSIYGEKAKCLGSVDIILISFQMVDKHIGEMSVLYTEEQEIVDVSVLCREVCRTSKLDVLRNLPFLSACSDNALVALGSHMQYESVCAGTELIALHSVEREFFVVLHGHVRISNGLDVANIHRHSVAPMSPASQQTPSPPMPNSPVSVNSLETTNTRSPDVGGYKETFGKPTGGDLFSYNSNMYGVKITNNSGSTSPSSPSLLRALNRPRTSIQKEQSTPKTERPYVLTAGHFFGEQSFIVDIPYPHCAIATDACVLLKISYDMFQTVCAKEPSVQSAMYQQVQNHIANQLQFSSVPFFGNIPTERLQNLGYKSKVVQLPKDAVVVTQGEVSTVLYVLMYGKVDVMIDDTHIATLKPGQYFGEVGLVMDTPRTATIITKTASILVAITREDFTECFEAYPDAYAEFSIKQLRHNVLVNSILAHPLGRDSLEQFCAKEHSRENFDFYIAVEEYKMNFINTSRTSVTTIKSHDATLQVDTTYDHVYEDMVEEAQSIWNTYISPGKAESEVNLKSENIKAVKASLFSSDIGEDGLPNTITPELFVTAQKEILFLMRDTQQRFVRDPIFEELLVRLGSYENKRPADKVFVSKLTSTLTKRQSDPLSINVSSSSTINLPPMILESPTSQYDETSTLQVELQDK